MTHVMMMLLNFQVSQGLSTKVAESRLETLGPNEVPFRPEPFWKSIVEEMFTLFKVYQFLIYSIWLWFAYLFVGALLFSIVLIAAAITIFNRRRSQFAIAKVRHRSMQIPQDVPHVDLCLTRHRDMQIQQVPHVELCLMRHRERHRERQRVLFTHVVCMQLTAYASDVDVRRDGVWTKVDFRLLVPGDLVRVRSSWSLPCDLLIIQGAH